MLNPLSICAWLFGITKRICMTFHKSLYLLKLFRNFPKNWSTQSLYMSKSGKSSWYLLTTSFMNSSYCNLALSYSFDAECLFSYNLSITLVNMLIASALLLTIFLGIKKKKHTSVETFLAALKQCFLAWLCKTLPPLLWNCFRWC